MQVTNKYNPVDVTFCVWFVFLSNRRIHLSLSPPWSLVIWCFFFFCSGSGITMTTEYSTIQKLSLAGIVIGTLTCIVGAGAPYWLVSDPRVPDSYSIIGEVVDKTVKANVGLFMYCAQVVGNNVCQWFPGRSWVSIDSLVTVYVYLFLIFEGLNLSAGIPFLLGLIVTVSYLYFVFQINKPAMFSAPHCYRPPHQASVCCLFKVLHNQYPRECVCLCACMRLEYLRFIYTLIIIYLVSLCQQTALSALSHSVNNQPSQFGLTASTTSPLYLVCVNKLPSLLGHTVLTPCALCLFSLCQQPALSSWSHYITDLPSLLGLTVLIPWPLCLVSLKVLL